MSERIDAVGISRMQQLPIDIISEILSRLSVKTLLRLSAVCKAWHSLIQTSNFIAAHLKKQLALNPERSLSSLLVVFQGDEPTMSLYSGKGLDESISLELPFLSETTCLGVSGVCNGLIAVSLSLSEFRVVIYNPSTRRFNRVPSCSFWGIQSDCEFALGFGYHPSADDYKLLKMLKNSEEGGIGKVEIYSVSTNSWRNIDGLQPTARHNNLKDLWASVTMDGVFYWAGFSYSLKTVVLSFDMNNESFRVIEGPPCSPFEDWKLTRLQGELAVVVSIDERSFVVGVRDENENGWCLKYAVGPFSGIELPVFMERVSVLGCRRNGDLILEDQMVGDVKPYIYDLETKEMKSLPNLGQRREQHYCYVDWYTESLVPVNQV